MRTNAITFGLVSAFLAAPALAAINFGKARYDNGNVDNAIWIDGESACTYVYMGPSSQSPCSYNNGKFRAQNGFEYWLSNCGAGNFDLLNADYSFNSFARSSPYDNAGNGCSNGAGRYHVDQEWQF